MDALTFGHFSVWHIVIATIIVAMTGRLPALPAGALARRLATRTKRDQLRCGGAFPGR